MKIHQQFLRKTYEKVYGIPLGYETIMHEDIPKYVLSTPDFENIIQEGSNKMKHEIQIFLAY